LNWSTRSTGHTLGKLEFEDRLVKETADLVVKGENVLHHFVRDVAKFGLGQSGDRDAGRDGHGTEERAKK